MRTNRRLAQFWLNALAPELGASAGTIDTYPATSSASWPSSMRKDFDWMMSAWSRSETTSPLSMGGYAGSIIAQRITVVWGLFETLYASGMRISEALALPSDAAPPGTRMLLVHGKGNN